MLSSFLAPTHHNFRDSTIRIVNLVDSNIIVVFKGHEGPIRSVSYDPKGDFIASAGTDGTVRIWSMKEREEVKSLAIAPKGEADRYALVVEIFFLMTHLPHFIRALQLTRLDWQPNGELLAVPTPEGIRMIRRGTWEVAFTLEGEHKKVLPPSLSPLRNAHKVLTRKVGRS